MDRPCELLLCSGLRATLPVQGGHTEAELSAHGPPPHSSRCKRIPLHNRMLKTQCLMNGRIRHGHLSIALGADARILGTPFGFDILYPSPPFPGPAPNLEICGWRDQGNRVGVSRHRGQAQLSWPAGIGKYPGPINPYNEPLTL